MACWTIPQMYCPRCKKVVNAPMRAGKPIRRSSGIFFRLKIMELPIEYSCEECKMTLQVVYPTPVGKMDPNSKIEWKVKNGK